MGVGGQAEVKIIVVEGEARVESDVADGSHVDGEKESVEDDARRRGGAKDVPFPSTVFDGMLDRAGEVLARPDRPAKMRNRGAWIEGERACESDNLKLLDSDIEFLVDENVGDGDVGVDKNENGVRTGEAVKPLVVKLREAGAIVFEEVEVGDLEFLQRLEKKRFFFGALTARDEEQLAHGQGFPSIPLSGFAFPAASQEADWGIV